MNTRDWPIRSKLTALVVVPVTALLALWIFATTLTFGPALDLLAARTLLYDLGRPGETVVAELQRERRLSVIQLAGTAQLSGLTEQRQRTDRAIEELRRRIAGDDLRDAAGDFLDARLDQLVVALDALPAGRAFIDQRQVDRAGAVGLYTGMVTSAFQAFSAMAALPDQELNRQALAVTALGRSRELLGQADALLAGAFTAGRFAEGEHTQVVQAVANHRYLVGAAVADLPSDERAAYQRLTERAEFVRLNALLDTVLTARARSRPPVAADAWVATYDQVQQGMREYELAQADGLADRSVPTAVRILVRLAAAGLLGLTAVVVAVVVALRVGRSLAHRLTEVRTAALDLAEHRLPDVVARLRRGEQVDVAREAPPLEYGGDEIGQVGRAFTEVQRTAVQAAVDEVTLRRGLNEVFLNIARRSQGLVHRQLALLDRMERDSEDPDELAELFRVDHLATRLRRHAEDLVILAGAAPGRGWRHPVAVVDLIRGAISEVESYDRVDITTVAPAGTSGRAVGDVMHLLAELIENATVFSKPDTRVEVAGQHVANGYVVEVTDHGLGMSPTAVEDANQRLARSPEFDPTQTARLGLFVVARLASRHGVRVRLRRGDTSGLTAVVLLPPDLVTDEPAFPADPVSAAGPGRRRTGPRPRSGRSVVAPPADAALGPVPFSPAALGPAPAEVAGEIDGLPQRVRRPAPTAGRADRAAGGSRGAGHATAGSSSAGYAPGGMSDGDRTGDGFPTVAPAHAGVAVGGPVARTSMVDGPTVRQPVVGSATTRSPEDAQRVMAALQAGTTRGRLAAGAPVVDGPTVDTGSDQPTAGTGSDQPGPDEPGPGSETPTTTERDA